jgi:hypothetical protein
VPAWAHVAGSTGVQWADPGLAGIPTTPDEPWLRADARPRPGEHHVVLVDGEAFSLGPAETAWLLWAPALSTVNSVEEHPEECARLAMVRCELLEVLDSSVGHAWLRVAVHTVVGVEEAAALPATTDGAIGTDLLPVDLDDRSSWSLPPNRYRTVSVTTAGGWRYCSWSAQGDAGAWMLLSTADPGPRLVLGSSSVMCESWVAMGNRPLRGREIELVDSVWATADHRPSGRPTGPR